MAKIKKPEEEKKSAPFMHHFMFHYIYWHDKVHDRAPGFYPCIHQEHCGDAWGCTTNASVTNLREKKYAKYQCQWLITVWSSFNEVTLLSHSETGFETY